VVKNWGLIIQRLGAVIVVEFINVADAELVLNERKHWLRLELSIQPSMNSFLSLFLRKKRKTSKKIRKMFGGYEKSM
jgi:hypothetical protein